MKAIIHADVFDGFHRELTRNATLVVEENLVSDITAGPVSLENFEEVIDASGKTVIPGLTDAHVHICGAGNPHGLPLRTDERVVLGVRCAYEMLMRGFTTVRDAGGVVYGLKEGIDHGIVAGPRIFPSNTYISQTCGHGDIRITRGDRRLTDGVYTAFGLNEGHSVIADGVPEMLRAVREQLFQGASQIKLMAGGGISSSYDPIQTVQFTFQEMKAAVDAARDYGTYVMAHLYTPESMKRALRAGIRSLEHGQLMDEETAQLIQESEAFIDPMPNFGRPAEDEPASLRKASPEMKKKAAFVKEGFYRQADLINQYDLKFLFGTDFIASADMALHGESQSKDLKQYKERFGSFRSLYAATGRAYELSRLTTYQNPYPEGKTGVLEPGSFADLLVVDGNPVEDIQCLTDPANLRLIMKDGRTVKNTL